MGSLSPTDFDYVICGGGTSGSVVAARLAEDPNVSVLVLEAGRHSKDMENVHMAGGWAQNFDSPDDWNLITEPTAGINNRQIKASRGRFLGGSSGVNGTLCIRGTKQDFDDWNMPGWSGEEVWRLMSKSETFHHADWFESDDKNHGFAGHLHTEPMPLAPISNLLLDSMQDKGLKLQHDMFTTGDNSHGCGHAVRTVYRGTRTTAADFLVNPPSNLIVSTNMTVDRVVLSTKDGEQTATGVIALDEGGSVVEFTARKEVIVSGGAYCSPAILMRSGIGDKNELEKHGIETKVNLPGVGKNLMDHMIAFVFYQVNEAGLTLDHLLYHDDNFAKSYQEWKDEKKGALSNFPFGAFGYARLDSRLTDSPLWTTSPRPPGRDPMSLLPSQPNIEFFSTECYGGPKQFADFPTAHKHCFSLITELFSPRSRGSVTLSSANPLSNPIIDHAYLSDPLDLEVLAEGCRFGNEIVTQGRGTRGVLRGSWPEGLGHHEYTSREEWRGYVRENATTCYHPGGTVRMGREEQGACLDERLSVRGVRGLRVADMSVCPSLNQGHTQMVAYAVGERCAEVIREDAVKG
ncbi:MAG: hypothetical protein MMC23_005611 [Stictis urceolatum]|nr:hypothetical protein [Stictis urceolata]